MPDDLITHTVQYMRDLIFGQARVIPGNYGSPKQDYGLRIFSTPPATPLTRSPEANTKGLFSSRRLSEYQPSAHSAAPTPVTNYQSQPDVFYQGMSPAYGLG